MLAMPEPIIWDAAGLDDDVVTDTCNSISSADSFVGGVNFNAPGQVVIAGHADAVDAAVVALKDAGARRAMPLPVSAPFHTPLMQPAADVMQQAFEDASLFMHKGPHA